MRCWVSNVKWRAGAWPLAGGHLVLVAGITLLNGVIEKTGFYKVAGPKAGLGDRAA